MSSFSRCLNQVYCAASLGSIAAVQQALRDKAAASDDEWVIGYGYDDSGISDNRHMNRHDLDAVCADRPVMVVHISVHMGYVNTIGLERLGFTADTKVPGGEIVLDGNGLPTGLLLENAIIEASGRLPVPTEAQVRESLVRAIAEYNKKGFTTFQDGGSGSTAKPKCSSGLTWSLPAKAGSTPEPICSFCLPRWTSSSPSACGASATTT